MNVLVLCDDRWHPAQTARTGLDPLQGAGFEFDFIEHASGWSATKMDVYPVVLWTKADNVSATDETPWITPEVAQAFADYVRRGGGLLVVHSGTVGYGDSPILFPLIGGVFTHHPKQCPVTVEATGALSLGVSTFTEVDEHYFMRFDSPDAKIFLTSTSEHGIQPAGWTREEGQGRVCVLTPGHNIPVWLRPEFQTLLRRSLEWCARSTHSNA
jgi:type 1 glutamine amidotransferase